MKPKNFVLMGVAGYIAPRHLEAIKDTGNKLIAAYDPHDSVGILDSYFDNVDFFTEFERFDRHLDKLRRDGKKIDYVTICSPNYLHDSHIRFALRIGANAICEKPLVLNERNLLPLKKLAEESGKNIYTVLQLRLHPSVVKLKEKVDSSSKKKYKVDLTYITPRGNWYFSSWKARNALSGGIATNIGIHFFDMLSWIFGKVKDQKVYFSNPKKMIGYLELENANVKWLLSLDKKDLPEDYASTFRSIKVDDKEIEFSKGFTDLHTELYKNTLLGKGFTIDDAYPSISLVDKIKDANISKIDKDKLHPLFDKIDKSDVYKYW